jgi:mono/diheme cytochrome c family protein
MGPAALRGTGHALFFLLVSGLAVPSARAEGDIAAGRLAAAQWCQPCHAMTPEGIAGRSVPSFHAIAREGAESVSHWRQQIRNPRHGMPDFRLSTTTEDDLIAFILSLGAVPAE